MTSVTPLIRARTAATSSRDSTVGRRAPVFARMTPSIHGGSRSSTSV